MTDQRTRRETHRLQSINIMNSILLTEDSQIKRWFRLDHNMPYLRIIDDFDMDDEKYTIELFEQILSTQLGRKMTKNREKIKLLYIYYLLQRYLRSRRPIEIDSQTYQILDLKESHRRLVQEFVRSVLTREQLDMRDVLSHSKRTARAHTQARQSLMTTMSRTQLLRQSAIPSAVQQRVDSRDTLYALLAEKWKIPVHENNIDKSKYFFIYHGTCMASINSILGKGTRIDVSTNVKFGKGFYISPYIHEVIYYANRAAEAVKSEPCIIEYKISVEESKKQVGRLATRDTFEILDDKTLPFTFARPDYGHYIIIKSRASMNQLEFSRIIRITK